MKFQKHFLIILIVLCSTKQYAQFQFSGEVNSEFINSTVYLNSIDNYKQNELFLTETIIQETVVDSLGFFSFEGNFLSEENKFYKIYIDKCLDNITDYNHLLNHCVDSNYIVFIANNQDTIHLPLNDLEQLFCSFQYSRKQNTALQKIDSVQETLLVHLQDSKSDQQRKIIYTNYFKELQNYSKSLNEPLAEIYSFNLYTDENSFSRPYYISDLKESDYYTNLLERMQNTYPNSSYTQQFENELRRDQLIFEKDKLSPTIIGLIILLSLSVLVNIFFINKNKKKKSKIDYKTVLSPQELKVFELMEGFSNKEIADQLFISISTVKTHINNIYSKLSISSRNDLSQFLKN